MVTNILKEVGVKYGESRYKENPLPATYIVFFDDREASGADEVNLLITHNITIEVYESKPDAETEKKIEKALNARGLEWTSQARYWIQDIQRYQVIYEFNYTEKEIH